MANVWNIKSAAFLLNVKGTHLDKIIQVVLFQKFLPHCSFWLFRQKNPANL